jgi:hypothetical protein
MSNFHVAASREVASNLLFEGAAPRKRRLLARGTLRGRRDTEELSAGERPPRNDIRQAVDEMQKYLYE